MEGKYDTEFLNMVHFLSSPNLPHYHWFLQVIFCSQSSGPLTFRSTRPSDWLGSPLRRHIFQTLESREVNLDVIRTTADDEKYVLTDVNNTLGSLQNKQGAHHWKRERFPSFL